MDRSMRPESLRKAGAAYLQVVLQGATIRVDCHHGHAHTALVEVEAVSDQLRLMSLHEVRQLRDPRPDFLELPSRTSERSIELREADTLCFACPARLHSFQNEP